MTFGFSSENASHGLKTGAKIEEMITRFWL